MHPKFKPRVQYGKVFYDPLPERIQRAIRMQRIREMEEEEAKRNPPRPRPRRGVFPVVAVMLAATAPVPWR